MKFLFVIYILWAINYDYLCAQIFFSSLFSKAIILSTFFELILSYFWNYFSLKILVVARVYLENIRIAINLKKKKL